MEESEIWLVIPTADRHQYLNKIFHSSTVPPSQRLVVRTKPGIEISGCINLWYTGNLNIHSWWNFGISEAVARGARYVAVLNDDVEIEIGGLDRILAQMKIEHSILGLPVSKGEAGWGHCWIIDTAFPIRPDQRFSWWCGDHDLEIQASRKGSVTYFPIKSKNLHANELTLASVEIQKLVKQDLRKFRRKYPLLALSEFCELVWKKLKTNPLFHNSKKI